MTQEPVRYLLSKYWFLAVFILLLCTGCSVTKTVPKNDALFVGYNVKVNGKDDSSNRAGELETELSATVRPKPNLSILGWRPKLSIYNAFYTEKEKGISHWIMTKLGEPPVLMSQVDTSSISQIMSNRLHNRGYFNNRVNSTTEVNNKKAIINWTAWVGEPYRIHKVEYTLQDSLPVHQAIEQEQDESLLRSTEPYDLTTLTQERVRIDAVLKKRGYYFFSPELLIFSVDSTVGNRQVDVLLRIKNAASAKALRPYTLDDIYINAEYSLGDSLAVRDTISVNGYHYIPNENYVKAKHLLRGMFLEQDSLYSREDHLLTIKRLSGLSAYKFVNIDYQIDTLNNDKLDAFVFLTPALKKSLRAELKMVTKSNGFAGPGLTVSFNNRNAFKGSELLNVEFTGNLESQVGGGGSGRQENNETSAQNSNLSSYELGVQTTLTLPRIVSPFQLRNLRTEFVPKTRIGLGFNFLNRTNFYQLNSYNASYGYSWRPKQILTFDATPINLQYVRVNSSEVFDSLLRVNPYLRRSFENQFIIGSIYQTTFSTQMYEDRTNTFFDRLTLDLSGNLISGLSSLTGSTKPTDDEPRTLIGQAFAQYVLVDNDFRHYLNIGEESQLVTRLSTGVGYSYGNSSTLPFVKQFSVGGPNSIRAFRARSVGPGTFNDTTSRALSYFDQTGDIRIESNIEYRFPIAGFFKGAVFVDAGNIWLLRNTLDESGEIVRPGGKFEAGNIISELAVGTGFGLRIDVEFFVIRLDLGIPVRVPYLPKGERFVLSDFNGSFSGDYGMVLNIAIGYPF
ncbi:translocation and assembly module lipoprotein TamL [Pontibacter cellulosilyticus]|uniref:BamA/TamA family outer membrane protein n=1 Tax=Pontibacter cellulosilyticus TaxID=1720253 RepID=A0A923N5G6_9BACT|nr:BamA/TamA family outer membrane protein [Pontibacter cellulosilyticus]MBC5992571.1 BamA/TamA family outer membrane protein [Pontibacter cellulosilyticus]